MRDDYRKIIIRRVIHQGQADPAGEPLNTSPASRWAFYLMLIPAVIVVVVLGAFFFSIVLALFAVTAAGVGARLWWLRRKFRQSMAASAEQDNGMIEDAEIIEIREDDKKNHRHD
ncbi:hypothetical protein ABO04_07655 [Nitrosomonas sp. HPC101]|uniref:hypothetical protein n=1 Tax=Nitrosomonas sp. HPC101 TaxID=1658667 RepID=UPI0013708960|nr:hypothetical protein [Nitrosomonas sp. HPC101]MXS85783.1 hypothetical protein [Nitrosomonas sp. HPC101]